MKFYLEQASHYIEMFEQEPSTYIDKVPTVRINKQQEEDERDKKERNVQDGFYADDIEYSDEEDAKEEDKQQDEQC